MTIATLTAKRALSVLSSLIAYKRRRTRKSPIERQVEHLKSFVSYQDSEGEPPFASTDLSKLRITWVIPDFQPGAGGHMTIFRIARYLEEFGHEVRFLIQNPTVHQSAEEARQTINEHFQPFDGQVGIFKNVTPDAEGDALIATDRFTCYPVRAMNRFVRKFYFVQDYESRFYPAGAEALLSEATYGFDLDCLCAGEWLHKIASEQFGRWSMAWPLAYDPGAYNLGDREDETGSNRIALYARYVTSRRAVELAFMALDILQQRGLKFEVDFFGWDLGRLSVDYPYRGHGVLSSAELAELYRRATVGIVFSATNHSLVNKEMMACGLPVMDLDLETTRAIFPKGTMAFAPPTPEGIADTLQALLNSPTDREALRMAALEYVKSFSWEKSARIVEHGIRDRVSHYLEKGRGQ